MSKLGGFLARKPAAAMTIKPADSTSSGNPLDIDEELFSTLSAQLGGENEALRNLLLNANYKIHELDTIKDAVGQLVEPVSKALRDFEAEKAEKIGLQATLATTRTSYSKLKAEYGELEKRTASFEKECIQLRYDLSGAQNQTRSLETAKSELTVEIAALRSQIVDLESRLQHEAAEAKAARDEGHRLDQRLVAADKRIVQLETELNNTRQKLVLAEDERHALQTSLDKSVAEAARLSRRLAEAENAISTLQGRLRHAEGSYAELATERSRLASTLDELKERHAAELTTQQLRFDGLHARAAATDRLLAEARDAIAAKAEEGRITDRRLSELTQAHDLLAARLAETDSERLQREADVQDLEQTRITLIERSSALAKAFTAKETALARAEETIQSLNERVAFLESQAQLREQQTAQAIEDLDAALRREKMERAVIEGALETGRKDFARLMREVLSLQRQKSALEGEPELRSANAA